ncbi:MAG TPA: hypothetical protein VN704_01605 [Verrucomicrobiae bacterium]|jgi:hypothetical protein|nr:hypothetical protein [Verrucomicrobiae bacterium]
MKKSNKNSDDVFESQSSVLPQRGDSNNVTSSSKYSKISYTNRRNYFKRIFNSEQELCQLYQEQIESILSNPYENNWNIRISKSHQDIFGYSNKMDYEEGVLKPVIAEIAQKRNLDFEDACNVVSSRIYWENVR